MEQGAGEGEGEVLAVADVAKQEDLEMMAEPNDMEGEQTWPTEEELAEAARTARVRIYARPLRPTGEAALRSPSPVSACINAHRQALTSLSLCLWQGEAVRRKQLLKKMGDYQASWFLDMDDDDLEDYESDEGEDADQKVHENLMLYGERGGGWECVRVCHGDRTSRAVV